VQTVPKQMQKAGARSDFNTDLHGVRGPSIGMVGPEWLMRGGGTRLHARLRCMNEPMTWWITTKRQGGLPISLVKMV
jgi:hypothetical protein